jgi:hypothetical protein
MSCYTRAYAVVGLRVDPEKLKKFLQSQDHNQKDGTLFGYVLLRRSVDDDFEFLGGAVLTDSGGEEEDTCHLFSAESLAMILELLEFEMCEKLLPRGLWEKGKFGVHVLLCKRPAIP